MVNKNPKFILNLRMKKNKTGKMVFLFSYPDIIMSSNHSKDRKISAVQAMGLFQQYSVNLKQYPFQSNRI